MSIKAGQLVTSGNLLVVDRLETGGPGQLNIPTTREFELGNNLAVATSRDIPDLTWTAESKDVTCDLEALLLNVANISGNSPFALEKCQPMDVASYFTNGLTSANPYDTAMSVAIPSLYLESLSYRFGLSTTARQTATMRGDLIVYSPGSAFVEQSAGTAAAGQTIALAHSAYIYNGDLTTGPRYTINVSVDGVRLRYGSQYTETVTGTGTARSVSVVLVSAVPTTSKVRITYLSDTVAQFPQTIHPAVSVKPAAIKGKDIKVYVTPLDGSGAVQSLGSFGVEWGNVQSAAVDWKATLDRDLEFGSQNVVSQDFDVPAVTGSIDIKPQNAAEVLTRLRQLTGVATATEGIGPQQAVPVSVDVVLHHPDTGVALKTLHVPDARFTLPGFQGRVQQKLAMNVPFESDSGALRVYRGMRA
ncbi:MAG: hypothetical protein ACXVYY_01460 [Oryzihumus sp.]